MSARNPIEPGAENDAGGDGGGAGAGHGPEIGARQSQSSVPREEPQNRGVRTQRRHHPRVDRPRHRGLTTGVLRIGRHFVNAPFFYLGVAEFGLLLLAVYIGTYGRFGIIMGGAVVAGDQTQGPLLLRALVFASVMISVMTGMGLYQARLREGFAGIVGRLMVSFLLGVIALAMVFYLIPYLFLGRGVLVGALASSFLMILAGRVAFLRIVDDDKIKRRVLILGAGERAASIMRALRRRTDRRGFHIVRYVHLPSWRRAPDIADENVVTLPDDVGLADYALRRRVQEIVVAVDERRQALPLEDLLDCRLDGTEITDLVDFFEREAGKVKLDLLSPSWMIFSDGFESPFPGINLGRIFDLVTGVGLLMVGSPIMLLTALAIWLESGGRGRVFYRQNRVGLDGKVFQLLKFRSMREDAEADGSARWADENDDRVTRVGRVIRRMRIDELPQIFNVLRGEMRLVGPRPERPEFVKHLKMKLPYYCERHLVRPGITGWAQLRYPYGSSDRDALEKLQYDLYYVKNRSLMLDLLILIQTVEVVLFGKGR